MLTHADVPGAKCVGVGPARTSPCWRSTASATTASRWRSSPPSDLADRARAPPRWSPSTTSRCRRRSDVEAALAAGAPRAAPGRQRAARASAIVHGDPGRHRPRSSSAATYEVGIQDQAFLGPEAGLARPLGDGGVELQVATQWLHLDREQVAAALGLPEEQVRLVLAGVGGAFGGARGPLDAPARLPARAAPPGAR